MAPFEDFGQVVNECHIKGQNLKMVEDLERLFKGVEPLAKGMPLRISLLLSFSLVLDILG